MKKRIFYVIHLDRSRILMLAFTMFGLLMFTFAIGLHLGSERYEEENALLTDEEQQEMQQEQMPDDRGTAQETEETMVIKEPSPEQQKKRLPRLSQKRASPLSGRSPSARPSSAQPSSTQLSSAQPLSNRPPKGQSTAAKSGKSRSTAVLRPKKGDALKLSNVNLANRSKKQVTASKNKTIAQNRTATKSREAKNIKAKERKTPQYLLQVGAFRSRAGAQQLAATLRKKGFKPVLRQNDDYYLVQVGETDSLSQSRLMEKRLKAANYSFIRIRR